MNYLNLDEDLEKEKLISQKLKNDWKYYKKYKVKRPFEKFARINAARKKGISIH